MKMKGNRIQSFKKRKTFLNFLFKVQIKQFVIFNHLPTVHLTVRVCVLFWELAWQDLSWLLVLKLIFQVPVLLF